MHSLYAPPRGIAGVLERECVMELKDTIRRLERELSDQGGDLEYYQVIVDGSWPDAVEILQGWLTRAIEIEKKREVEDEKA